MRRPPPPADVVAWARFAYRGWRDGGAVPPDCALPGDALRALGLGPLAYRALKHARHPRATDFAAEHRAVAAQNLRQFEAARSARDVLEAEGIAHVLFKGGAFLVRYAAGDLGVRHAADLDVLVEEARFADACRALSAVGWRPLDVGYTYSAPTAPATALLHGAAGAQVALDLHRRLAQKPLLEGLPVAVLSRRERVGDWWLPTPADGILVAASHRARHGFALDARDLVDVRRAADGLSEDDWPRLVAEAARLGLTGALYAIAAQSQAWFCDEADRRAAQRLAALGRAAGPVRRALLDRMATPSGPLTRPTTWQRPLARNLVVTPVALHAPVGALVAAATFLPRRAREEWHRAGPDAGTAERLMRVLRLMRYGSVGRPD